MSISLFPLCLILSFFVISSSARNNPTSTKTNSSKSSSGYVCGSTSTYGPSGNFSSYVCDPKRYSDLGMNMKDFAFCDSSLSYSVRVEDLINRMTLDEKVQQLGDTFFGIPRLGIPVYEWWSDALHGVANIGQSGCSITYFDDVVPGATSFPEVILTAATFNESLWKLLGQVINYNVLI